MAFSNLLNSLLSTISQKVEPIKVTDQNTNVPVTNPVFAGIANKIASDKGAQPVYPEVDLNSMGIFGKLFNQMLPSINAQIGTTVNQVPVSPVAQAAFKAIPGLQNSPIKQQLTGKPQDNFYANAPQAPGVQFLNAMAQKTGDARDEFAAKARRTGLGGGVSFSRGD
jgi:hypothetical protein